MYWISCVSKLRSTLEEKTTLLWFLMTFLFWKKQEETLFASTNPSLPVFGSVRLQPKWLLLTKTPNLSSKDLLCPFWALASLMTLWTFCTNLMTCLDEFVYTISSKKYVERSPKTFWIIRFPKYLSHNWFWSDLMHFINRRMKENNSSFYFFLIQFIWIWDC